MKLTKLFLVLSVITTVGILSTSCGNSDNNSENQIGEKTLFISQKAGFNPIFYLGDEISYDGIVVYDGSTLTKATNYTFSIPEGTILNSPNERLEITVSKDGYECGTFNIAVIDKTKNYDFDIDIYSINDFHGAFKQNSEKGQPGLPKIVDFLIKKKNENPFTVILSAGDMWQGGVESNKTKGNIVTEAMNFASFDAMTIGNHEFDWGEEAIKNNASMMNFPFLGANVFYTKNDTKPSYLSSSTIINRGEFKIGVIGTIGDNLEYDILQSIAQDFNFKEEDSYIRDESAKLKKQGCNLVFLLAHDSGFEEVYGEEEFKFKDICYEKIVDGIFLGHDHREKNGYYYGIPYVEGGRNGEHLSHMSFSFQSNISDESFEMTNGNSTTIDCKGANFLTEHQPTYNLLNKYKEIIGDVNRVIYTFTKNLTKDEVLELACKAIMTYLNDHKSIYKTTVKIGMHNYGGIRTAINKGEFTYSDLISVIPFDNTLTITTVSSSTYRYLKEYNYVFEEEAPSSGNVTFGTINYVSASTECISNVDTQVVIQDAVEYYLKNTKDRY